MGKIIDDEMDVNSHVSLSKSNFYVGSLLRKQRIKKGLSGHELAKQVYLSQQQISRYECGKTGFQIDTLLSILVALNLNDNEIRQFFSLILDHAVGKSTQEVDFSNHYLNFDNIHY